MKYCFVILFLILLVLVDLKGSHLDYSRSINQLNQSLEKCDFKMGEKIGSKLIEQYGCDVFYCDYKKIVFSKYKLGKRKDVIQILKIIRICKKLNSSDLILDFGYIKLTSSELKKILSGNVIDWKDLNTDYIRELKLLYKLDQEIRNYDSLKLVTGKTYNQLLRIRDSIDILNGIRFCELIEKYGFPNESNFGAKFNKSDLYHTLYVLGIHFCLYNENLFKKYYEAMIDGKMHPSMYASVSDFVFENSKGKKGKNYMNTVIHKTTKLGLYKPFIYYSDSLMNVVNSNRVNIGLDSFNIAQQQTLLNYGRNCLFSTNFEIYSYPKIEEFNHGFVEKAFEIEKQDLNSYLLHPILKDCLCVETY